MLLYLIWWGRIGVGSRGEPPEVQGFWAINNCQMSMILYLSCDTGRSRFVPGSSGVLGNKWAINYCQMSMLLYPSCDTGRSRIGEGSRGGAPGSSGVLGNKFLSDVHALIP